MFEISEAMRNAILTAMASNLNGGVLRLYQSTGTIPASPNDAVNGTLICTVSNNGAGTGINFDTAPVDGVIVKAPAETWKGENVATGVPDYYRFSAIADAGGASEVEHRAQGTVDSVDADLNLLNTSLVSGEDQEINYFAVGMPESA